MPSPLSSSNFSSIQPTMGATNVTPVQRPMGAVNTTPVAPRMGGMNINVGAPNLGLGMIKTPVAPRIGTTNTTPIQTQQFGAVNKSATSQNPYPGQPLFHGSQAGMKPGTVIQPGGDKKAWSTVDIKTAEHFANQGHSLAQSKNRTGQNTWKQPAMFNPVYEVEPVKPADVQYDIYNKGYAASKSGFRVKNVTSWTSPDIAKPAKIVKRTKGID